MSKIRVKPSRLYYGFGCLNWFLGFVVSVVVIVLGMKNFGESMEQYIAPGEHEVYLDKKGTYTIYQEFISNVKEDISFTKNPVEGLTCELSRSDGYEEVPVYKVKKFMVYFTGARAGVSLFEFRIINPGIFTLLAFYPEGDDRNEKGNQAVLTIGHQDSGIRRFFILGIIILVAGFICGCVIIYKINNIRRVNKLNISTHRVGND